MDYVYGEVDIDRVGGTLVHAEASMDCLCVDAPAVHKGESLSVQGAVVWTTFVVNEGYMRETASFLQSWPFSALRTAGDASVGPSILEHAAMLHAGSRQWTTFVVRRREAGCSLVWITGAKVNTTIRRFES